MKPIKQISLFSALLLSTAAFNAHATLYDRGNGLIYDSAQNITWLQDANYANTSGYPTLYGGLMTWDQATAWANTLAYQGLSGWRLASANPLNPTSPCFAYDGSCDRGYNNTRSEIGHLYDELGNLAYHDAAGAYQPGYGATYSGPFFNVKNSSYWEGEQYAPRVNDAWSFSTSEGLQDGVGKISLYYAWAVRDGDVATVPVPASAWLFGSGLIGLVGAARRNRKIT